MANKGQMTGMRGVYLTAVELVKLGFIVSPTSRSAAGADLLVTDQLCQKAWSVQVKTNHGMANFWLMGAHARKLASPSHIYVFVSVPKNPQRLPYFYIVPSRVVASKVKTGRPGKTGARFHAFFRIDKYLDKWELLGKYKDKWKLLGNPTLPFQRDRPGKAKGRGDRRDRIAHAPAALSLRR